MDLSIIVPVYNVEKYIQACLESIFKQGLDDDRFEVIIVNDGTKDKSMEVITDIINQHKNITVINQDNQSLSIARNNGISIAKGEYILMADSDDLLIYNSLSVLLDEAIKTKADLIVADFLEMNDEEIACFDQSTPKQQSFEIQEKTGEQLFLEDLNPYECYVWRTLYRRQFIIDNSLSFYPGIRYQDVPFTHESYIKAKKCIRTHWLLNIYRKGHESATFSFDKQKANDYCIVIGKTWELMSIPELSPQMKRKLEDDIYTTFSLFYYSMLHSVTDYKDKLEIVDYLKVNAPTIHFSGSLKKRIESFLLFYSPHLFLALRILHWNYKKIIKVKCH